MERTRTYDNFPVWIALLSNLNSVLIYCSGFILTLSLGLVAAVMYLVLIFAFEYRLISKHCVNCYYLGKTCGFGKGRLSALLFKRGDPSKFCEKKMTFKDLIPDLLITLIPLATGLIFLIIEFKFIILIAIIVLVASTTVGNGFIRGSLTCKFCKQRELGCPAEQFFSKTDNSQ
jgi:hypothetical protein